MSRCDISILSVARPQGTGNVESSYTRIKNFAERHEKKSITTYINLDVRIIKYCIRE